MTEARIVHNLQVQRMCKNKEMCSTLSKNVLVTTINRVNLLRCLMKSSKKGNIWFLELHISSFLRKQELKNQMMFYFQHLLNSKERPFSKQVIDDCYGACRMY